MRKVVRLAIAVAFVAGVTVQVSARADTLPVVASGGGASPGWIAIEWTNSAGAQGAVTVTNNNVFGPGFASAYLYDANDHALAGGNVGVLGNLQDVHVQANLPPVPPAEQTVVTSRSAQYGAGVTITFDTSLPPGTYKAIFVAGGRGTGFTWALEGNAAVAPPSATTSGSDVYSYSAKDFSGTASVQAYAGAYNISSMGAAANLATERSITAKHTLVGIGFFAPGAKAVVNMSMDGPGGTRSCNCALSDFTGPGAAGPGTWNFTYTGVGAGPSNFSDLILGVADAYLPEP
jgi:hypothetical protein